MLAKNTKCHGQRHRTLSLTVIAIARVSELVFRDSLLMGQHEKDQVTPVQEVNHFIGKNLELKEQNIL